MATVLLKYQERGFWMHTGCAEVVFEAVRRLLCDADMADQRLLPLQDKLVEALHHRWIDGVAGTFLDAYLGMTGQAAASLLDRVEMALAAARCENGIVALGEFSAASDFLFPELQRLRVLIAAPNELAELPEIYAPGLGWRTA